MLALDGNSVRGRRDEPRLDRRAQRVRAVGENHSPGILSVQGCRIFSDGLGWLDGPFGRSLGRGALFALGNWPNFSMQQFHMVRVPDEIGATAPFVK